ncbi:thiamine ABC transporter substrate-binding protein, partial [Vibrio campbellii]
LPQGFATLTQPENALSFSADEVAQKRRGWIRDWQHALTF